MSYFLVILMLLGQVPPGGQNWILVLAAFAGLGFGAASAVPWAIVSDVVEADELVSGQRREGVYFGYLVFFRKLAAGLSAFIVGFMLDRAGYLSSTTGTLPLPQPESALLTMRFLISVVPAVLFFLAVLVAWRYPLTKDVYNDIRRQLQERRQRQMEENSLPENEAEIVQEMVTDVGLDSAPDTPFRTD